MHTHAHKQTHARKQTDAQTCTQTDRRTDTHTHTHWVSTYLEPQCKLHLLQNPDQKNNSKREKEKEKFHTLQGK